MIKIILSREALLPALALANKAVERRSTIPVMQNLLLIYGAGRLTVTGSDLDAEIQASCAATAEGGDTSFTLPAATLHDAVRKLPAGAEIAIDIDNAYATISSGRSRFRLPVLPAGDFPLISAGTFGHEFTLPATALAGMIDTVSFAISTEETRHYLNGIFWDTRSEPGLVAVATDGHRLAKLPMGSPPATSGASELRGGAEDMPSIILPRRMTDLLKSMLPEKGDVQVSLSETRVRFQATPGDATVTLTSKLIDGTFPDYRRVIPAGNANRFSVERAALAAAIDRVTTISSTRGSAVKFAFGSGEVALSAISPETGSAEETVPVKQVEGEPVTIGFNGRYCLDMLAAIDAKSVTFALGSPGDPAVITPESGEALFVIMPMRV